jgi:hypothetical protein
MYCAGERTCMVAGQQRLSRPAQEQVPPHTRPAPPHLHGGGVVAQDGVHAQQAH